MASTASNADDEVIAKPSAYDRSEQLETMLPPPPRRLDAGQGWRQHATDQAAEVNCFRR
jgi:hypothetical protein